MKYLSEKEFIITKMRNAIVKYNTRNPLEKENKSEFDIVTEIDKKIECYLIDSIHNEYPYDKIISEETMPEYEHLSDRTWIIDPIDGTCNMASGICLYGVQCALIDDYKIVLSVIILPEINEEYYAIAEEGAFLNSIKINVSGSNHIANSIVSFGDYSHSSYDNAKRQHNSIGFLFDKVAKIRMFGSAAIDFSYVASNKTDSAVLLTRNIWDIAPGILLCKESGVIVTNLQNKPYQFGDYGVIASSNREIHNLVIASL